VLGNPNILNLQPLVPQDSVSMILGDKSGLKFCGPRQFLITSSGYASILSFNNTT